MTRVVVLSVGDRWAGRRLATELAGVTALPSVEVTVVTLYPISADLGDARVEVLSASGPPRARGPLGGVLGRVRAFTLRYVLWRQVRRRAWAELTASDMIVADAHMAFVAAKLASRRLPQPWVLAGLGGARNVLLNRPAG